MSRRLLKVCTVFGLLLAVQQLAAAEVRVAVASNFLPTARTLTRMFQQQSDHRVLLSSASSGKLYAQIRHGAPFDLFLSADAGRPERLAAEGLAAPGEVRSYAIGRLVFWMPEASGDAAACKARLLEGGLRLALANPRTAPYGSAAWQTLLRLGLDPDRLPLIQGENVAQAFTFVASGGVDGGFVSASQLATLKEEKGCRWPVPDTLHSALTQKAVLLKRGAGNPAARKFFDFLFGSEAREQIAAAGFRLP